MKINLEILHRARKIRKAADRLAHKAWSELDLYGAYKPLPVRYHEPKRWSEIRDVLDLKFYRPEGKSLSASYMAALALKYNKIIWR